MRIHTDLTYNEITDCTKGMEGVWFGVLTEHGSRSRERAFEVQLRGTSNRAPNMGTSKNVDRFGNPERAATWDEWGIFLNALFEQDATATATYYSGADNFHYQTDYRFEDLEQKDQCSNHKWEYAGVPRENACKKCGAVRRWL